MPLSTLRVLNLCIRERVENLQEKRRILDRVSRALNAALAENDTLKPNYLTLYLKASEEVQKRSDKWFEVLARVERLDVIILLCEEFDRL